MASIEKCLERQVKRLAKAKADLEAAVIKKDRTACLGRVVAHQRNIIRLEGRLLRKQSSEPVKSKKEVKRDFYTSAAWRQLRYRVLSAGSRMCSCCGATPATGAVLHVDHIKPKSLYPELALDIGNLQILCAECNLGKSNLDATDFR